MSNFFDFNFSGGVNYSFMQNFLLPNFLQPLKMYDIDLSFNVFNPLKQHNCNTLQNFSLNSQVAQSAICNFAISGNIDTFEKSSSNTVPKTNNSALEEYNEDKGKKLAKIARKNSVGWRERCVVYVKNAIQEAGLGKYVRGYAYQMVDILRKNKNFKEISPNTKLSSLPEGCVLVYGKKVAGYSKDYGHTEITVFNKKTEKLEGVSDGITKNIRENPTAIFIPV